MTASDSVKANISSVYGAVAEGGGTLFGTGAHGKAEPAGGSGCCGGGSGGCGTSADGNAFVNTPTSCCGGATVTAEELSVQMGYTENEIKSVGFGREW